MITGNPIQHSLWGHFDQLWREQNISSKYSYFEAPSPELIQGLTAQAALGNRICRVTSFLTMTARVAACACPLLAGLALIVALRGKGSLNALRVSKTLFLLAAATSSFYFLFHPSTGLFNKKIFLIEENTKRAEAQQKRNEQVKKGIDEFKRDPIDSQIERVDWHLFVKTKKLRNLDTQTSVTPAALRILNDRIALLRLELAFLRALKENRACEKNYSLEVTQTTDPEGRLAGAFVSRLKFTVEAQSGAPARPLTVEMLYPKSDCVITDETLEGLMTQKLKSSTP